MRRRYAGIIMGMGSANVKPSLIGWTHTQNDPCHVVRWLGKIVTQWRHVASRVLVSIFPGNDFLPKPLAETMLTYRQLGLNTFRPRPNGRHFPENTFKLIFLYQNGCILIRISFKFVPTCPIEYNPTLVLIMAWRRPGDKPLSEPLIVRLPTHICVIRPQWVNNILTKF